MSFSLVKMGVLTVRWSKDRLYIPKKISVQALSSSSTTTVQGVTQPLKNQQISAGGSGSLSRYNRYKFFIRWTLRSLFLLVMGYGILVIWSRRAPQSSIETGLLGKEMAVAGPTILLTHTMGEDCELLFSRDSGRTFRRTSELHLAMDSSVFLAIAPDSQTMLVLEPRGVLHYCLPGEDGFQSIALPGPSTYKGFAFLPATDTLFAYGNFGGAVSVSWKWPVRSYSIPFKRIDSIDGMAFDSTKIVITLAYPKSKKIKLQISGDQLSNLDNNPFLIDSERMKINDTPGPRNRIRDYRGITYASEGHVFCLTYAEPGQPPYLIYVMGTPHERVPKRTHVSRFYNRDVIPDTSGRPIYFGNGPFIQKDSILDSIANGSDVLSLGFEHYQPVFALAGNASKRYIYEKSGPVWTLNPILIRPTTWPLTQNLLLWAIGILLVIVLSLYYLSRMLSISIIQKVPNTVNELLTKSEKPLGLQDPDLLGFSSIEEAIIKIVRNPQLELPMTIVISGTWGSGKSSMMNRIRERLGETRALRRRFMTTWFNAWHLQGETSLLNSFLLNIIACYEKYYPMYSQFRIRLFARRFLRLPLWKVFGIGFAGLLILPFVLLVFLKILNIPNLRSLGWVDNWCTILSKIFLSGKNFNLELLNPVGAASLIIISLLFLNKQFVPAGLSAFFELLPKNNFKLDVEAVDIGSREKFRQQYWEIMQAARPDTRLVIFIDDLDRVGGDKILELLEGINFISDIASRPPDAAGTQPNTIFVLGMYTQEVARLVGTKLQEVNKADLPPETLGNFYIEKMVQLIVPVPFNSEDQALVKQLYAN
jgi:hypothetical protein